MKPFHKLLALSPLLLTLTACVIAVDGEYSRRDHQKEEQQNRERIADLKLGTPLSQIRKTFGDAAFSESYRDKSDEVLVLFYRTQWQEGDGITSKSECTPLIFKNGELAGWGETLYAQLSSNPL